MYYLLTFSIIFASLNSIILNRAKLKRKSEIFFFNFLVSAVWLVIFFILNKGSIHINRNALLWGIIYGITQAFFVLFKTLAMGSGPVSITTLIGNFSLIVSVMVSLILWNETFTAYDVFGIFLLLFSIFLCTYKKNDLNFSSKWKYFAIFFFIFAAGVGIVFKAFGKSSVASYCSDMMLVASIVMLACFFILSLVCGGFKCKKITKSNKRFLLYAVLCGLLSCVYNRLNIFLAGKINAVIFFPAFNGGVILLSALLGIIMCKEKLSKKQVLGILTGTLAIAIIGIF